MERISNDPERPVAYRIRWGNVALALAALLAIVAALALPRGSRPAVETMPDAALITAPTAEVAPDPRPAERPRPRRRPVRRRKAKHAPLPVAAPRAAPTPAPEAHASAPPPIPAADREFGP